MLPIFGFSGVLFVGYCTPSRYRTVNINIFVQFQTKISIHTTYCELVCVFDRAFGDRMYSTVNGGTGDRWLLAWGHPSFLIHYHSSTRSSKEIKKVSDLVAAGDRRQSIIFNIYSANCVGMPCA